MRVVRRLKKLKLPVREIIIYSETSITIPNKRNLLYGTYNSNEPPI